MTPAEQRVLDAARAYRDASQLPGNWRLAEGCRLFEAARMMPRTLPPPVVTDNPAEVVQGEVRQTYLRDEALDEFSSIGGGDHHPVASDTGHWYLAAWQQLPLVSRPGVDL